MNTNATRLALLSARNEYRRCLPCAEFRTSLCYSAAHSGSCDDYRAERIEENCGGAHADGYDLADYMDDVLEWALMVWRVAETNLEGYLYLAATRDYRDYEARCEDAGATPVARGKWCHAHVLGQIDRALEIADEI